MIRKISGPNLLFWSLAAIGVIAISFMVIIKTVDTMIIGIVGITGLLIWHKPRMGLFVILLLPVLGEFGRLAAVTQSGVLLSDLLIGMFIGIWIVKKFISFRTSLHTKNPLFTPLIIFSIIGVLSLIHSLFFLTPDETIAGSLYLVRFIEYALLAICISEIIRSEQDEQKIVMMMVFSAILIAIGGFIQLMLYPDLGKLEEFGWDPHQYRLVSTWLDPNFIGGFLAFMIMIITSIGLHVKTIAKKTGIIVIIIILGIALFLTYSRSTYLAFATGVFIIGILKSKKLIIAAIIMAIIGLSFSARAQERVNDLVHSIASFMTQSAENPDPTARLRLKSWQQTISLIQKRPLLGSGYNTLRFVNFNEGFVEDTDVHSASGSDSSILTILATTGFLGLIPFIILYWNILKLSLKNWQTQSSYFKKGLGLGVFAGILTLFVHSFFVNSLLFPQIMIFFWVSVGLLGLQSFNVRTCCHCERSEAIPLKLSQNEIASSLRSSQ